MNTAAAITHLIHLECQQVARRWDPQGIYASVLSALEDDNRRADQVVLAGFAAVNDPNAQTPAAIRWAARYQTSPAAVGGPVCAVCSRTEPSCRAAAAKSGDDHQFTPRSTT